MAKKKNVVLEFEAKLGKLIASLSSLDNLLKGQIKSSKESFKQQERLLRIYEKQASTVERMNAAMRRQSTTAATSVRKAKEVRIEVEKTAKAHERLSTRQIRSLQRRIGADMGLPKGALYTPKGRHGRALHGSALEASLLRTARQRNVPTDNLHLSGSALSSARNAEFSRRAERRERARARLDAFVERRSAEQQQARVARRSAAKERLEAYKAKKTSELSEAIDRRRNRREGAEVRLANMRMRRRWGINADGSAEGVLGAITNGRPIFKNAVSAKGGLSGTGVAGMATRGALGGMLGGPAGAAAAAIAPAAIGSAIIAGLGAAGLVSAVASLMSKGASIGIRTGFDQALSQTFIKQGFAEILGQEGFNPVAYTDMMLKSRQELLTGTQSRAETDRLFNYVTEISKKTPFDVASYTKAAAVGTRYGVDLSKEYTGRKGYTMGHAIGDLASGNNKQLEDAVFTFLHEYIATGDARSLKYRFSITPDQMVSMARTQGFRGGADTVQDRASMVAHFAQGQFGGAMERQSATLTGKIADIRDSFILMMDKIGQVSGYMRAVEFFERIRVAIEKLDEIDPETGMSQLDALSKVAEKVYDFFEETVTKPISDALMSAMNAESFDDFKAVLAKGIEDAIVAAAKMAVIGAVTAVGAIGKAVLKTAVSPITKTAEWLGTTETDENRDVRNNGINFIQRGYSAYSGRYDTLNKFLGVTDESLTNLGVLRKVDSDRANTYARVGGFFSRSTRHGDLEQSRDTAFKELTDIAREHGLSGKQLNSIAANMPAYLRSQNNLKVAQAKVVSSDFSSKYGVGMTPEAVRAAAIEEARKSGETDPRYLKEAGEDAFEKQKSRREVMKEQIQAAQTSEHHRKLIYEALGPANTPEEIERRDARFNQIVDLVKKGDPDANTFAKKWDETFGRVGQSEQQRLDGAALKAFEDSKNQINILTQIHAGILETKEAIVNSVEKLFNLQDKQQRLQDSIDQRRGVSPYKQSVARAERAWRKAEALRALNEQDGYGTEESLEAERQAYEEASNAQLEMVPNDPYSHPAEGVGREGRGSRSHRLDLAQYAANRSHSAAARQADIHRTRLVFENASKVMLENEKKSRRDSAIEGVRGVLANQRVDAGGGVLRPMSPAEIDKRIADFTAKLDQQLLAATYGVKSFMPPSLLEQMGGGTTMIDKTTGKALSPEEIQGMSPEELSKRAYSVSDQAYVSSLVSSAINPESPAAMQALNMEKQLTALDAVNTHLSEIHKTLKSMSSEEKNKGKDAPKGSEANAKSAEPTHPRMDEGF